MGWVADPCVRLMVLRVLFVLPHQGREFSLLSRVQNLADLAVRLLAQGLELWFDLALNLAPLLGSIVYDGPKLPNLSRSQG